MARKLLIFGVFAGLAIATATSGTEIRRFLDGQLYNLAMVSKGRLPR
jgi:hypothetical protein